MNDKTIEQEIQAKGDSPAIRVTPDMITAAIVSSDFHVLPDTQITVCTITLRNGTKVLGYNYGAIDPARQDWQQGRQAAYDMAREKVWELEGYALRERLAVPGLQPIDTAPPAGMVPAGAAPEVQQNTSPTFPPRAESGMQGIETATPADNLEGAGQ